MVLVFTNSINGLYSFRKELVHRLADEKFKVVIAAPLDQKTSYFKKLGYECIDTSISRRGKNPIADIKLLMNYIKLLKNYEPDVVLTYTIKPNVYGGLACRLLRIPYIANITGLGTSIESKGIIKEISLHLYKISLRKARCVFFQNGANYHFFKKRSIVKDNARLIPGSGVNLEVHSFKPYPEHERIINFLFMGRLMKAKGIEELLQAAQKVKNAYSHVRFTLIGRSEEDYTYLLKELQMRDIIKYYGHQNDVNAFIKESHAVINPSHHEGMSNVLLESASSGRPVIASNIPGCRETFDEEVSGFGFEVKNAKSLVEVMEKFIDFPYEKKKKMGIMGRKKMEKEFDRNIVVNAYIDEINKAVN